MSAALLKRDGDDDDDDDDDDVCFHMLLCREPPELITYTSSIHNSYKIKRALVARFSAVGSVQYNQNDRCLDTFIWVKNE